MVPIRYVAQFIAVLALAQGLVQVTSSTVHAEPLGGAILNGAVGGQTSGYRGFFLPGIAPAPSVPVIECLDKSLIMSGHFSDRLDYECLRPKAPPLPLSQGFTFSDIRGPRKAFDGR